MAEDDAPSDRVPRRRVSLALSRVYLALTSSSRLSLAQQVRLGLAGYALILVILVAFGISGTSSGVLYHQFYAGTDPHLLLGSPQPIRSDEWLVVSPLTVSQVQQGLPRTSGVFPGGLDTSIVWDLPYREWSVLLRPHMWGFFFLPLDNAFAFKWWLPFVVLAGSVYVFLCLLWRRPFASFAVAGAFVASPFFQWWFGAGSFWVPACAVWASVATIVMLRSDRAWVRWALGGSVAYLVAVAAVGLYPPFLIPCIFPALGFCLGWLFTRSEPALPWSARLRRLLPLGVGGAIATAVLLVFMKTRASSVDAVMSTVYPGHRLYPTGVSGAVAWRSLYAGVFGMGLRAPDLSGFAVNASEGSSFIFLGLYLLPSAAWLVWSRWRRGRGVDWTLVGTTVSLALLFAFIYVPGWDAVAHLLYLDRTTAPRIVIGLGLNSILLLGLIVSRLREEPGRIPLWTTIAAVVAVLVQHAAIYYTISRHMPAVLAVCIGWPLLIAALAVAIGYFSRGRMAIPGVLVAIVGIAVGGWVNPFYRGVLDLRETPIGHEIESVNDASPGAWVAVSGIGTTAVLRETGVVAYSGVQAWPSTVMWNELDPDGSDVTAWNRYAHVNWTTDPAAPEIALVAGDVVHVRFDSCGSFAQHYLQYVLSDTPVGQACVRPVATVPEGPTTFYVYQLVPSR